MLQSLILLQIATMLWNQSKINLKIKHQSDFLWVFPIKF